MPLPLSTSSILTSGGATVNTLSQRNVVIPARNPDGTLKWGDNYNVLPTFTTEEIATIAAEMPDRPEASQEYALMIDDTTGALTTIAPDGTITTFGEEQPTLSYRGFMGDDQVEYHYTGNVYEPLAMQDIQDLPGSGVSGDLDSYNIVVGDTRTQGIRNTGPNLLNVLVTANVTLSTPDAQGTSVRVAFIKNSTGLPRGNPASLLLVSNQKEFSTSLTASVTLDPQDYVCLFMTPNAESTIITEFVNLTALQIGPAYEPD